MNELMDATNTIDSRDIAEMASITHWELLRKLEGTEKVKGIIPVMTDNKIVVSDFFAESAYRDDSGKLNKCYLFTKKGCEFIANKFTGEKGIIFTAKYVDRFNQMQEFINYPKLSKELQAIFAIDQKQQEFDTRLSDLEGTMTIDFGQQRNLQVLAQKRAIECIGGADKPSYKDKTIRTKVFQAIWRDYKDYLQVASYRDTLKKEYEKGFEFLGKWMATGKLLREIELCNNQLELEVI